VHNFTASTSLFVVVVVVGGVHGLGPDTCTTLLLLLHFLLLLLWCAWAGEGPDTCTTLLLLLHFLLLLLWCAWAGFLPFGLMTVSPSSGCILPILESAGQGSCRGELSHNAAVYDVDLVHMTATHRLSGMVRHLSVDHDDGAWSWSIPIDRVSVCV
jgi:hypothetical protein